MPSNLKTHPKRLRLRELGYSIGRYPTGRHNAITDVRGVRVGHSTIIKGSGRLTRKSGPIRTGVTAILPNEGNVYFDRVVAGGFVLNGAGEVSGLTQVMEWGLMETPILLTNTLSVGTCNEALVRHMLETYPSIGNRTDVVIPLVGECDDSWLNDIAGTHVRSQHVIEALENTSAGAVEEGCVGGGTGMLTCDFKSGIGTSSRKLPEKEGGFTVGVLVMSNFGEMEDLRLEGIPAGRLMAPEFAKLGKRKDNYGSIIAVVATDAPMATDQINRLSKRVALGIGRVGSYAAHGSGEIILGFSTANKVPRERRTHVVEIKSLLDQHLNPLYAAAIEATEEAIWNALCKAEDMEGIEGHFAPAVPLDRLKGIIDNYKRFVETSSKPL
jgi:D-aminopeptidase